MLLIFSSLALFSLCLPWSICVFDPRCILHCCLFPSLQIFHVTDLFLCTSSSNKSPPLASVYLSSIFNLWPLTIHTSLSSHWSPRHLFCFQHRCADWSTLWSPLSALIWFLLREIFAPLLLSFKSNHVFAKSCFQCILLPLSFCFNLNHWSVEERYERRSLCCLSPRQEVFREKAAGNWGA